MTSTVASNGERLAARSLPCGGTPTPVWIGWGRRYPELDISSCPALVLVAPHPDDETLGFGATAALLAAQGVDVQVVSVSDGGAAYPDLSPFDRTKLERIRRSELRRATGALGVGEPICLGLPDGELSEHEERICDDLSGILSSYPPGTWCAATWRGDGHPDHEGVGRAAAAATQRTGAVLLEYPVWMWHWASPDDPAVPWQRARSVPLPRAAVGRKQLAAQNFRSQFEPVSPNGSPVLPPFILRRLLAVGEVVFL
jgi:LmbE family N-acetylglucosaminyl deacetylase